MLLCPGRRPRASRSELLRAVRLHAWCFVRRDESYRLSHGTHTPLCQMPDRSLEPVTSDLGTYRCGVQGQKA